MSEFANKPELPAGYSVWASFASAFLSTLFASFLASVSLPLFASIKLVMKNGDISNFGSFGPVWFLTGIFSAFICFRNCILPNWVGLFCWYHFLRKYPVNNALVLYVCGSLYGLFICMIGVAIENYVWPGKGNVPSLRLSYKDIEAFYFLTPAAFLSGVAALKLLSMMMKEYWPPLPADH